MRLPLLPLKLTLRPLVGNFSPGSLTYERGLAYLQQAASLALEPDMVYIPDGLGDRIRLCTWVDTHIQATNARLDQLLLRCHQCFYPQQQRPIRILAVPLAEKYGIDGCCNINLLPVTMLLDVGRVNPEDWLRLVVHEYAHAYVGHPGHQEDFVQVLTHLCLGLGLPAPPSTATDASLRHWPHYQPVPFPLHFWHG